MRSCGCSSAGAGLRRLFPFHSRPTLEVLMLWACVLLPQLALDGVMRRCSDPDEPLALISGSAQRRVLQAANPAARAL
ncbi:hypothetical protein ALO98_04833, partial [Pseudomonas syringae pv. tagetis]